ncbi:uncharacterized protein LOC125504194 [Dendroctonus ponderosae]|uniref:uncharacterized protein LOC125504194 n=1 Tax=Dendroctonus ponderosae TaxID=77166 RepID=UPI002034FABE|nr:uncharacterized protein LOC125504194 [Dendroctonus ponderosae]XP_048521792.1 uncharacterized protein LOC125504194 [Dendroctonus ponderosae]KAH1018055.1 hypothetical protein HUJ05_005880 [Dendroctonus ponderosae]
MPEKRRSIHELLEPSRRTSLFEQPGEEGRSDAQLKEWEKRWGYIKPDFVNVISYPDENARACNKENDDWTSGLKIALEEAGRNSEKLCSPQVISCNLSNEQKVFSACIESKIYQFLQTASNMARDVEIEAFQKLTLDEDWGFKLVERLITSKLEK